MKLKTVKLSGFKSFVDLTVIQLRSNLTGIVGPNGCGKSNIMDAIRWVMGEISAKQLRGDTMADVIFNGSSTRNKIGKASVELVFDNTESIFGGAYSSYNEISLRREVNRDGFSNYFINNVNCRRKDITNIFLGTGLGNNSYAIIEQGTISQFIEAKPEEIRSFIEEAAGISKYKERRKETENKIKNTRENLFRLNDIIMEVDKQLKHLQSQANAAERYRNLKDQERQTKADLHVLHLREANQKLSLYSINIKKQELEMESSQAELNIINSKILELREQHCQAIDEIDQIRSNYYKLGEEIIRKEQQIQYIKDRNKELLENLSQNSQNYQNITEYQASNQKQIEHLEEQQQQLEEEVKKAASSRKELEKKLQQTESEEKKWQENWHEYTSNNSELSKTLEIEQTRIEYLEQRSYETKITMEKEQNELVSLHSSGNEDQLELLGHNLLEIEIKKDDLQTRSFELQEKLEKQREKLNQLADELYRHRHELQKLIGRKSSLEALQQAALGNNDSTLVNWLAANQLTENLRLAQKIKVETGWENALEIVLDNYLEAIFVDSIASTAISIEKLNSHIELILIELNASSNEHNLKFRLTLPTLASKVKTVLPVNNLLQGIYIADNSEQAFINQKKLQFGESIITAAGLWLGPNWLRVPRNANPNLGVIQREKELEALIETIRIEQDHCATVEENIIQHKNQLLAMEKVFQNTQDELNRAIFKYSEIKSQISAQKIYQQQSSERLLQIKNSLLIYQENLASIERQLKTALDNQNCALKNQSSQNLLKENLLEQQKELQTNILTIRNQYQHISTLLNSLNSKFQSLKNQLDNCKYDVNRDEQTLLSLRKQKIDLEELIAKNLSPLSFLEEELNAEIIQRLDSEKNLTLVKQAIAEFEQQLKNLEQKQQIQQEANNQLRRSLEKFRTECHGLQILANTYSNQIRELNFDPAILETQLSPGVNIQNWEEKLVGITAKIDRLGLINLAAIEEFKTLTERKQYLDAQNLDLIKALEILENIIKKIDFDTKEQFREVFDKINSKFQEIFPEIFNGGKAYLEKTEDNLLETGVLIMAEPPGKRNSSIHLLSGGEKALTAISLIFAIFHLNPAPFCILDEIDAPLDDLNTIRFSKLVNYLSENIQFIFITHNKITMEIANQLIGVTMTEPGVSRIVSVDIKSAISLANCPSLPQV